MYPVCVGHEIVGKATRVGKNVARDIKVGDVVGVGAQSSSCLKPDCEACADKSENHCPHMVVSFSFSSNRYKSDRTCRGPTTGNTTTGPSRTAVTQTTTVHPVTLFSRSRKALHLVMLLPCCAVVLPFTLR